MKAKFTYEELIRMQVINPAFEPSVKDYAKALVFANDYFEGKRRYVVTSKPFLWALALQRLSRRVVVSGITRFEELSLEKSQQIIAVAKSLK